MHPARRPRSSCAGPAPPAERTGCCTTSAKQLYDAHAPLPPPIATTPLLPELARAPAAGVSEELWHEHLARSAPGAKAP